jgi:hypothetical protein
MLGMDACLHYLSFDTGRYGFDLEPISNNPDVLLWFEFLAISPSYELARRYRTGQWTDEDEARKPEDFEQVLAVYDDLGDVQNVLYSHWWYKTGRRYFAAPEATLGVTDVGLIQLDERSVETVAERLRAYHATTWPEGGGQDVLVFAVPTETPSKVIGWQIESAIEQLQRKRIDENPAKPKYSPISKRMHMRKLMRYLAIIYFRSLHPEATLWKIGAQVKLSSVYHEKRLDPVFTVPNKENVSDRIALASLTSRAQKRAWYIAENAARGVFPSYASTTTAVEFDFVSLKTLMLERDEWRISAECHAHGIKRETYSGRTLNSVFKFSSSKAVRVKK